MSKKETVKLSRPATAVVGKIQELYEECSLSDLTITLRQLSCNKESVEYQIVKALLNKKSDPEEIKSQIGIMKSQVLEELNSFYNDDDINSEDVLDTLEALLPQIRTLTQEYDLAVSVKRLEEQE